MKSITKTIANTVGNAAATCALTVGTIGSAYAQSTLPTFDLTKDQSGGKKFSDVANNINSAAQTGTSLMLNLFTMGGFVIVGISLYTLYKASKEERDKPTPAIVGLFIGGAMAAVGSIAWIMKNTVIGS